MEAIQNVWFLKTNENNWPPAERQSANRITAMGTPSAWKHYPTAMLELLGLLGILQSLKAVASDVTQFWTSVLIGKPGKDLPAGALPIPDYIVTWAHLSCLSSQWQSTLTEAKQCFELWFTCKS